MGKLAKTLALGGALGLGYLLATRRQAEAGTNRSSGTPKQPSEPTSSGPTPSGSLPGRPPSSWPAWPVGPIVTPAVPGLRPQPIKERQRLNQSSVTRDGTVRESPNELLKQARRFEPAITLDELTGARLAASEFFGGTFSELCCIVDSELNRAKRRKKSLFRSLTFRGTFGQQGSERRASTRRDPQMRHLVAARAVLSGQKRGIARGAIQFFNPTVQLAMHQRWLNGNVKRRHCHPLVILERWCLDLPWAKGKGPCVLDRQRPGTRVLRWVGDIPGVDPTQLLLFAPGTRKYRSFYKAARNMLEKRIPGISRTTDT
ncbi:MAG: hypothetical protein MJE77_16090 [Proteobacteria bacterium]|nr:hypothetical protein [Pseudomonadota bacterium]